MLTRLAALALLVALAGCFGSGSKSCLGDGPSLPLDDRLIADAGPDFEARPGEDVQLDGSASLSTGGGAFEYSWTQVSGPCARLDLSDPARPRLTVPEAADQTLVYRLHVVRDGQMSALDEAEVVVAG